MADISKITLPSGNTYDIKDAVARQAIAGGVSYIISWNGSSTPVVANIPAGVVVTYNDTDYTGTFAANSAEAGAFYLVHSSSTSNDVYDEYVAVGTTGSKTWERLGSSTVDLSDLGALAYKDTVTASDSAVTFSGGTTDKVLGSDATFTTTVTPTTTNIKATASGAAVGASSTDKCLGSDATFTTTVTPSTTSVPNVTAAGSASTWSFAMGTGADAETLIISGANGNAPTLGTAISVVNGITSASTTTNSKDEVTAITGVSVTTQPTVSLATGATAGTGVISVATGISSASTSTNNKDEVTAVTNIGTGTAEAQTLTIS